MLVIITDTATRDEAQTETALRRSGYVRREVWIKEIASSDAEHEAGVVRALGVGRFAVTNTWGRGPE
jgi:hypothetical protein